MHPPLLSLHVLCCDLVYPSPRPALFASLQPTGVASSPQLAQRTALRHESSASCQEGGRSASRPLSLSQPLVPSPFRLGPFRSLRYDTVALNTSHFTLERCTGYRKKERRRERMRDTVCFLRLLPSSLSPFSPQRRSTLTPLPLPSSYRRLSLAAKSPRQRSSRRRLRTTSASSSSTPGEVCLSLFLSLSSPPPLPSPPWVAHRQFHPKRSARERGRERKRGKG